VTYFYSWGEFTHSLSTNAPKAKNDSAFIALYVSAFTYYLFLTNMKICKYCILQLH
jgi:hypothetical protein